LLLPIIILFTVGTGIAIVISAVVDTTKHMASGGRSQTGDDYRKIYHRRGTAAERCVRWVRAD
jgi:hypothetical protein